MTELSLLGIRHLQVGSGFTVGPGMASIQYQMMGGRLVTLCNFAELCHAYMVVHAKDDDAVFDPLADDDT